MGMDRLYAGYDALNAALSARSVASPSALMNLCTAPLTAVRRTEKVTSESIVNLFFRAPGICNDCSSELRKRFVKNRQMQVGTETGGLATTKR